MSDETTKEVEMIGVWLTDGSAEPIALFEFEEHAEDWARDNYFGQWFTKSVSIPVTPLFTQEEWDDAQEYAEKLMKKFKGLPEADA